MKTKNCQKLIESKIKNSKGRSVELRKKIKKLEKIENPSILERFELCLSYSTLTHIPFPQKGDVNEIYKYCIDCKFKASNKDVFQEMHKDDK